MCINNQCTVEGGCVEDEDCPPMQSCLAGFCVFVPPSECEVDADCGAGEICNFGFCEESTRCRITADCPEPEQVCIDEFCRTPIECRVDEDCAGSEICDERGQCVPR